MVSQEGASVTDLLTHPPLCHRFCRNRKDGKCLRHDLPKQLRELSREWDPSITLQTLKEEMNSFE
jgi:hypothetical protein